MDEASDVTRRTYDVIGDRFIENARERATMAPWLDRFAAALPAGALVVDIGAGAGMDAAALRARGLRAAALDFSLGMLRAGRGEFPAPRLQGDARRLPLATGTLAGAWANGSLHHLSGADAARALAEMRRVLCPPGLLYLSVKEGVGAETETDRYGLPRFFQYWNGPALDAALETAGFDLLDAERQERPRNPWLVRLASVRADARVLR